MKYIMQMESIEGDRSTINLSSWEPDKYEFPSEAVEAAMHIVSHWGSIRVEVTGSAYRGDMIIITERASDAEFTDGYSKRVYRVSRDNA